MTRTTLAAALGALFAVSVEAQTVATDTQRDANQQQRVEQGLQSGQLSTREAASLEHQEKRIDATQARDLRDGSLSAGEKAQIQREQNAASADIRRDKTNAVIGNPGSASSQRMQADVQRNVNQQGRIAEGVQSGALTHRETGALEHGQANVDRAEARAGADGHVGAPGQARIQAAQDRQSRRVYAKKHNARNKPGA